MRCDMRNIALFVTYLGTHYHGWQVQKKLASVGLRLLCSRRSQACLTTRGGSQALPTSRS